ncbi:hypothetical protein DM860_009149 [Cuscuta australis]|uniref:Uncharacterized protein n=1 Tax=Cuscuta australis TaxID=267555 RepID=A0A328D9U9_9ASTE|nr:hypothetical protein DM860_009149 [Cuscuta australis]
MYCSSRLPVFENQGITVKDQKKGITKTDLRNSLSFVMAVVSFQNISLRVKTMDCPSSNSKLIDIKAIGIKHY